MEPLASTREVAEFLGVKPQTLDYWASNGKGPVYVKLDGRRRYDWNDIRAYIEERKVRT